MSVLVIDHELIALLNTSSDTVMSWPQHLCKLFKRVCKKKTHLWIDCVNNEMLIYLLQKNILLNNIIYVIYFKMAKWAHESDGDV